jgi:hypothetical protein
MAALSAELIAGYRDARLASIVAADRKLTQ